MKTPSKSSLPPARALLLERMQQLRYGTVEGLVIRDCDPVFDPPPRFVRDVKFGANTSSRVEPAEADFRLKDQVRELFEHFDELGNGTIRSLQVANGLPLLMKLEDQNN